MKKTYATSMPNHIGAFLKASKCFATLGINITRVSYDKSVDSHMLFLDVEGTEEQILKADEELEKIGYLQNKSSDSSIVLIEFTLKDVPGSVTNVLELINQFNFNISYINSVNGNLAFIDIIKPCKKVYYRCLTRARRSDYRDKTSLLCLDRKIFYNRFLIVISKIIKYNSKNFTFAKSTPYVT